MAMQFAAHSSKHGNRNENPACGQRGAGLRSRGSQVCSGRAFHNSQKRGPSHGAGDSNDLVVQLLPLVRRVAQQLRGRLPAHVELDDLVSDGTVGLIDAVRKFDPGKGVTIESYARYRIRGAILDSLRDQDHASRDMRRRIKKIESTCQDLERKLGRPVVDLEVALAMGMGAAQWYERVAELQHMGFEGAGGQFVQEGGRRVNEETLPAAPEDSPFELCYRGEQRALLSHALRCLTLRERAIITLYYQQTLTMKQIGARLGIDESRVSQLHSGAVARLRSRITSMVCRPEAQPGPMGALKAVVAHV
jgi:RNA polymerase sigma factor for flagellar operon FliA